MISHVYMHNEMKVLYFEIKNQTIKISLTIDIIAKLFKKEQNLCHFLFDSFMLLPCMKN